MIRIHHFPDVAPSMVVPNSNHSIPAELLQRFGVICMLGDQIDVGSHAHVEQFLYTWPAAFRVVQEHLCLYDLGHRSHPIDTPLQVLGMLEVVEGNTRVFVDVCAHQIEMTCRQWLGNLLQNKPSPECFMGYIFLPPQVSLNCFRCPLLWRDS